MGIEALTAEMERVKRAYIRGLISEAEAEAELPRIRAELEGAEERIALAGSAPSVISLQPAAIAQFRRSTGELIATLDDHARHRVGGSKFVAEFRQLIETVTIKPDGPRLGFEVEVHGRLDELIREIPVNPTLVSGGCMVAREGFEPPTQGL